MKKAFMSLKFHDGEEDKKKIEDLTQALLKAGIKNVVMARDVEKYGKAVLPEGTKLMPDYAFPAMKKCDMLIVELELDTLMQLVYQFMLLLKQEVIFL